MISNPHHMFPRLIHPLWMSMASIGFVAAAMNHFLRIPPTRYDTAVGGEVTASPVAQVEVPPEGVNAGEIDTPSGSVEPTLKAILAEDIGISGQWKGFKASFQCSSLIIRKDGAVAGKYRLVFVRDTDLGLWHFKRTGILANGVLTLNKPIREVGFRPTTPYSVLYTVRTSSGEFLLPSVNAESMKSADNVVRGFAYQRSDGDATDAAMNRVPMGTGLDDAIERMAQVVPVIVRSELKSVPLLFELSFGPACWLATKTDFAQLKTIAAVYEPLIRIALHKKGLYGRSLRSYATALSAGDQGVHVLLLMAAALIPDEVLPVDTR